MKMAGKVVETFGEVVGLVSSRGLFSRMVVVGMMAVWGICLSAGAGTIFVDFHTTEGGVSEGATPPQGWTYTKIGKSDGTANFNAINDAMLSPTYSHTITNISIEYKCSDINAGRFLKIVPLVIRDGDVETNETQIVSLAPTDDEKAIQNFTFDVTGMNAFLIVLKGSGSATWKAYSATIKHTGPEILVAPTGLLGDNVTSNSFTASWNAVLPAESYALRVWQEPISDPTYTAAAFEQTFNSQTNENKSAKNIDDGLTSRLGAGWEGTWVYLPAQSDGIVQIGKSGTRGFLLTPEINALEGVEQTLLIRARRCPSKSKGALMPIELIRAETTNAVTVFTLTDEWAYHAAPLKDLMAGDRLLFHSMTNGSEKRAWIDSVQIVSGYAPGVVTTNEIFWKEGITETTQTVTNLQEGAYSWAVRADATEQGQLWSETRTVSIEPVEDEGEEEEDKPEKPQSPTGLEATHVTSNSFAVVWAAVPNAEGYLVTVTTNSITPAREGDVRWRERFPWVASSSSAENISIEYLNGWSDWNQWSGTNIFTCTTAASAVQLGNTKTLGTLSTGPLGLAGTGYALKLMAWRPSEGKNLPIEVVRGAETNLATDVALTKTAAEYVVVLPELAETDGLVFHSTTNASYGRVCLDELSIVADYVPEFTTTVVVVDRQLTPECSFTLDGLLETRVTVQVAAIVGGVTNVGEALEIDLAHSPAFGAWRTSTFVNGMKAADFGFVTDVTTSSTGWVNGVTIAGFHAYKNGEDLTKINRDDGNESAAGLYATSRGSERSLSLLGTGSSEVALELHILNENPIQKVLDRARIDFTAYQWTFTTNSAGEMVEQTLAVDWAVTEDGSARPADSAWQTVEEVAFAADVKPEEVDYRRKELSFDVDDIRVPFGGMLWVRWRVGKVSNSPMLGVGNVRAKIAYKKEPTLLFIR